MKEIILKKDLYNYIIRRIDSNNISDERQQELLCLWNYFLFYDAFGHKK